MLEGTHLPRLSEAMIEAMLNRDSLEVLEIETQ
jgi:hypothetical protein